MNPKWSASEEKALYHWWSAFRKLSPDERHRLLGLIERAQFDGRDLVDCDPVEALSSTWDAKVAAYVLHVLLDMYDVEGRDIPVVPHLSYDPFRSKVRDRVLKVAEILDESTPASMSQLYEALGEEDDPLLGTKSNRRKRYYSRYRNYFALSIPRWYGDPAPKSISDWYAFIRKHYPYAAALGVNFWADS